MFKAQILRRGFSLWTRTPNSRIIQSAARDGHETIRIQRVRFRRRVFSRSRLLGTAIVTTGTYAFLRWLGEEDEDEEAEIEDRALRRRREPNEAGVETDGEEVDEEEDDEDEDEDDAEPLLFLPTGFSRPKPKRFYKGTDPEWQEFIRLAPDKKRTERIRAELVIMIRELVANSDSYKHRLGEIMSDKGNSWVEIKFPDGPPPEYERPGIEVTEDLEIRRATRPVHEHTHMRLTNTLFPAAVANSLYADLRKKAGKGWEDLRTRVGWEDKTKLNQKALTHIFAPPQLPTASNPGAPTSSSPTTSGSDSAPSSPGASQPSAAQPSTSPPQKQPATPALGNSALERLLPSLPPPTNMTLDLSTFHNSFRKEFIKRHKHQPPRGSFIVSGLIEVVGDRARATLDVAGAYDPKLGRYVMIKIGVRSITDNRQHPKGGH